MRCHEYAPLGVLSMGVPESLAQLALVVGFLLAHS